MKDCGPAVQTLGGILKITNKETFVPVSEIARRAQLPQRTAEEHLATLAANDWIVRVGRQRTRGGRLRRTATIKVTAATRDSVKRLESDGEMKYGILPWWACCSIRKLKRRSGRLPWSAKAVLSIVMARLCSLKAGVEREVGDADADDIADSIEDFGGETRFQFPLVKLMELTGLDHKSASGAKRILAETRIIEWIKDDSQAAHMLVPNWDLHIIEEQAGNGFVTLEFGTGNLAGTYGKSCGEGTGNLAGQGTGNPAGTHGNSCGPCGSPSPITQSFYHK